jgi:hypothetical protein
VEPTFVGSFLSSEILIYVMKKLLLIIAVLTLIMVSCKNEERPQIVTYECSDDFGIWEEPERTITLGDTVYYFWSIRDCGTGKTKCLISVKRNKNEGLYDE